MKVTAHQVESIAGEIARQIVGMFGGNATILNVDGEQVAHYRSPRATIGPVRPGRELRIPFSFGGHRLQLVFEGSSSDVTASRTVETLVDLLTQKKVGEIAGQVDGTQTRFIRDLLQSRSVEEIIDLDEAYEAGFEMRGLHAVVLVDASEYILGRSPRSGVISHERVASRRQFVLASIAASQLVEDKDYCVYIGNGEVALLMGYEDPAEPAGQRQTSSLLLRYDSIVEGLESMSRKLLQQLREDTASTINVGIGRPQDGAEGIIQSHQDARQSIVVGRAVHGNDRVYTLRDLGIAAFTMPLDEPRKVALAECMLKPLEKEAYLIETVAAFFENDCRPSPAAERLHIHRNTLSYRLDSIALLSGYDPRRFDDAVQLRLALELRYTSGER
jgi:carbohydrate diacid regulator